ncbi:MAG: phosphoribosylformylglycinamidine synthase subunit PurS, partial [Planctomycetes bacterium]|nr:phosphoribosylformylglycinamidine synthase subunit PurS [Planctomycetota bacterium]
MQAWRVDVLVKSGQPDPAGEAALRALQAAGLAEVTAVRSRRGFLLGRELDEPAVRQFAAAVLSDPIADEFAIHAPDAVAATNAADHAHCVAVVPRPGVTDPVAHSVQKALVDMGLPAVATGTYRAYDIEGTVADDRLLAVARKVLANDVVQEVLTGLPAGLPGGGGSAELDVQAIALAGLDRGALEQLSRQGGLALDGDEMTAIQAHFAALGRAPTRMELETLAQTWSEHCKHKTLTGNVTFDGRRIENLLKSTIAHVTRTLDRDFCVSVFVDNAGVIRFDDEDSVCIKVETHNRPSAIEPFGGAGTGVGGVIRDVLGTGLGARPIASTDVFCFAPPDLPAERVPAGCLPPRAVLEGVVAGVRDYGNPMGIPTVNG